MATFLVNCELDRSDGIEYYLCLGAGSSSLPKLGEYYTVGRDLAGAKQHVHFPSA
jgi:hypothetical protein